MGSHWLLVEAGAVIDGTGGTTQANTDVLIKDNRIFAVGPRASMETVPRGETLRRIDARGMTVMPGLIDAHCHMSYGEARSEEEIDLYTSHELRTLKAARNIHRVLRAGVTSISDPGGSYYLGVGLREAASQSMLIAPRVAAAGRYLTTSNGLTDWYPDSVGVPEGSIGVLTNTPAAMVNEIRHQVKNGVDFIKVADSPSGKYQAFTTDEMKRMADLAHQLGKGITIHARGQQELSAAVEAGFDWIMHGNYMDEDTAGRLAESGIPLVPTLVLLANATDWGHHVGTPQPLQDRWRRMLDETSVSLHRAHAAGVTFVAGTDSGFALAPYGEWHARELELLMTYAGLSVQEAIAAATKNAAVTLGLGGQLGTLEAGMLADVIVVNGDPIANIRVLQNKANIKVVIKDGTVAQFDESILRHRWPVQRGLSYSQKDLTYELAYDLDHDQSHDADDAPDREEDAAAIVHEIRHLETNAQTTTDH